MSIHSIALAVPASSPYKTLADLVKAGKSKEYMTASVSTKGASVDITFLLFGKAAGIKVTTIPGSGGADAITKLVGGHVDFGGGHPSEILPHMKAGRLRALAVALEQRDASIPDVPTFREAGYDVVTAGSVKGVAAPKGTPKEVIAYLEKKFKEISEDAEFKKIMTDLGQPVNYHERGGVQGLVQAGLRPVRLALQVARHRDQVGPFTAIPRRGAVAPRRGTSPLPRARTGSATAESAPPAA